MWESPDLTILVAVNVKDKDGRILGLTGYIHKGKLLFDVADPPSETETHLILQGGNIWAARGIAHNFLPADERAFKTMSELINKIERASKDQLYLESIRQLLYDRETGEPITVY